MGKSVKNKKNYDDDGLSKNHGESIKYRKRIIQDREARQEREDALKAVEDYDKWYEHPYKEPK